MEHQAVDPWLAAFEIGVFLASIAIWLHMISVWRQRLPVISYQPRRPVLWGPIAMLPAMFFVLLAVWAALTNDVPPPAESAEGAAGAAQQLLVSILFQSMVTAAVIGIVAVSDFAVVDLGVYTSFGKLARDFGIGVTACLAAAAPVYGTQGLLLYFLKRDDPSRHPLIEMVTDGQPHFGILILAAVAAVIVAPICEEITYRLVLQGWLEKWEDQKLGWRGEQENDEARMTNDEMGMTNDEARMTNDEESNSDDSSFVIRHSSFSIGEPPRRGLGGLPYGWFPILTSSSLFALAHFGYGPEPVPIFLLALFLGYVYQRTHRIIPCIVAHALFNLLTMLVLWRMVFHAAERL